MTEPTKCKHCGGCYDGFAPCGVCGQGAPTPAVPAPPQAEGPRETDGAVAQKADAVPGTPGAVVDSTSHGTQGSSPASTAPASPETPDAPLTDKEVRLYRASLGIVENSNGARLLDEYVRRVRLADSPSGPRPDERPAQATLTENGADDQWADFYCGACGVGNAVPTESLRAALVLSAPARPEAGGEPTIRDAIKLLDEAEDELADGDGGHEILGVELGLMRLRLEALLSAAPPAGRGGTPDA